MYLCLSKLGGKKEKDKNIPVAIHTILILWNSLNGVLLTSGLLNFFRKASEIVSKEQLL